MNCSYCHKIGHTLNKCNGDISMFLEPFVEFVAANPFALRQQYSFLCNYSKPVLSRICKNSGIALGGSKTHIAGNIVRLYFARRVNRFDLDIGPEEGEQIENQIQQAYTELQSWLTSTQELNNWRLEMMSKLDTYNTRMFGVNVTLMGLLRTLNFPPHYAPENNKAHLQQLQINVSVEETLEISDCFICCENKHLAELGCGHSYCTDCIVNIAVTRTKSHINCAICRQDIAEIKVGTEELREAVSARLAEE